MSHVLFWVTLTHVFSGYLGIVMCRHYPKEVGNLLSAKDHLDIYLQGIYDYQIKH